MTVSTLERKGFISLLHQYHSLPLEEVRTGPQVGQEAGGRADAEVMEGSC